MFEVAEGTYEEKLVKENEGLKKEVELLKELLKLSREITDVCKNQLSNVEKERDELRWYIEQLQK